MTEAQFKSIIDQSVMRLKMIQAAIKSGSTMADMQVVADTAACMEMIGKAVVASEKYANAAIAETTAAIAEKGGASKKKI